MTPSIKLPSVVKLHANGSLKHKSNKNIALAPEKPYRSNSFRLSPPTNFVLDHIRGAALISFILFG